LGPAQPARQAVAHRAAPAAFEPSATPAAENPTPVAPPQKPAPPPTADPLADLQTAVPYTLQQAREGNILALLPPDTVAEMSDDNKAGTGILNFKDPKFLQRLNAITDALQSVQGVPPTMTAEGDFAFYTLPVSGVSQGKRPVGFQPRGRRFVGRHPGDGDAWERPERAVRQGRKG
jgi:hypothetical protein